MKRLRPLSLLVLLALASSSVCSAAPPQKLFSRFEPSDQPKWVAAEAAVTEAGELDWKLFRIPQRTAIQDFLASDQYKKDGCVDIMMQPMLVDMGPANTLDDFIHHSLAIYSGTITSVTPGFHDSQPGMLLEIKVSDILKRHPEFWIDEYLYMFYKKGNFEAGGISFCTTDYRLPAVPPVGAEIIVFPYAAPLDSDHSLINPYLLELLYQGESGPMQHALRLSKDSSFGELENIEHVKKYVLNKSRLNW